MWDCKLRIQNNVICLIHLYMTYSSIYINIYLILESTFDILNHRFPKSIYYFSLIIYLKSTFTHLLNQSKSQIKIIEN